MKKVAVYIRVSTSKGQTTKNQLRELRAYCKRQDWNIVKVYEDNGISGTKADRPALKEMMTDACKGRFDIIAVWKIDRLARSTADLLHILTDLKSAGVDFVSTTQAIDTSTSYGKMVMTFLGAVAEFEADIIKERVMAGLSRARADGTQLGRPRRAFDVAEALRLQKQGMGYKRIAKALNVPKSTLYHTLRGIEGVRQTQDEKVA